MKVRALIPSDIPLLKAMQGDFPYPSLDPEPWPYRGPPASKTYTLEAVRVVVDDDDQPVMAAGAKRIIELYLWCRDLPPTMKLHALRLLHQDMARELRALGYSEANLFLPPEIEKSFGDRLRKSFGWKPNWKSFFLKF